MATLSTVQSGTMYQLLQGPLSLNSLHTATVASLVIREWVTIKGDSLRITPHGKKSFDVEIRRDYAKWKSTLHDTAIYKRKLKNRAAPKLKVVA